jgi:Zn finger protein HypA/HybF involved in hydrogenase expression
MATIKDLQNKLKNFGKELECLSGKRFTIQPDTNGMIVQQCPNPNCQTEFKVNGEDWEEVESAQVYCPTCGFTSKKIDFLTSFQKEEVKRKIQDAISDNWKNNSPISHIVANILSTGNPIAPVNCAKCNARFNSLKGVKYCPRCGSEIDAGATL